ncbi:MAG: trypsin-like peptidase domain-containing protein [Candidatus Competibacteraceae bacterium]
MIRFLFQRCGCLILVVTLATAVPVVHAGQYETIDYYVQQMIAQGAANDEAGLLAFREQLEALQRPESGDPQQAQPHQKKGLELLARNNLQEALAAFRQAFIANATDPEIADNLGLTYLRLRRFKEAERLLVYALTLGSDRATTWLHLGQVYGQLGDVRRATGAFANAYRFTQDRSKITAQLRELATTDATDTTRISALQALQLFKISTATSTAPSPPSSAPTAAPSSPPVTKSDDPAVSTSNQPSTGALLGSMRRQEGSATALVKPPQPTVPDARSHTTHETASDKDNPGQQIYQRSIPLTCLIVTFRNGKPADLGSGLLVSPDGLVITNHHVIEKAENLAVKCGGQESAATVRKRSRAPDLALLATSLKSQDSFVLNKTYGSELIGLDIFVIGNPYGLEGTFSTGVISGLREIDGVRYIQISAPISPGNSGGPVILRDGTVIGIATMGLKMGQNLNFAIATTDVIAAGFFDPDKMKHNP